MPTAAARASKADLLPEPPLSQTSPQPGRPLALLRIEVTASIISITRRENTDNGAAEPAGVPGKAARILFMRRSQC
jgi:hypothetical protein